MTEKFIYFLDDSIKQLISPSPLATLQHQTKIEEEEKTVGTARSPFFVSFGCSSAHWHPMADVIYALQFIYESSGDIAGELEWISVIVVVAGRCDVV